jgi:hypothetical protein
MGHTMVNTRNLGETRALWNESFSLEGIHTVLETTNSEVNTKKRPRSSSH